jgi:hypothetical protein
MLQERKKKHQTRKKEERKKDATCELCIQAFFANVNKL